MAWKLKKPLFTVACNEDMTASDLTGRYLLDANGTRWVDGPESISNTIPWPGHGLPQDFCVLLANGWDAFTHKGSRTVCHG